MVGWSVGRSVVLTEADRKLSRRIDFFQYFWRKFRQIYFVIMLLTQKTLTVKHFLKPENKLNPSNSLT